MVCESPVRLALRVALHRRSKSDRIPLDIPPSGVGQNGRWGPGAVTLLRMSVADLLCDICGRGLSGSAIVEAEGSRAAVRLMLHPGDPLHKDDSVLVCRTCWKEVADGMGPECIPDKCSVCGDAVVYDASLHVLIMTGRMGDVPEWQFCRPDAVGFLNRLRTTEPKLQVSDLALKADFPRR